MLLEEWSSTHNVCFSYLTARFLYFFSSFASAVLAATSCYVILVWIESGTYFIWGGITCVLELLVEAWIISKICHHVRCNSRPQQQVSLLIEIDNVQISQAVIA